MPAWGNYVLAVVTVLALVLLVAGWLQRRQARAGTSSLRATVAWITVAWITVAGLAAWSAVLIVSQVTALQPDDGAIGQGAGLFLDAVFALVAIGTAAMLIRDALALGRTR